MYQQSSGQHISHSKSNFFLGELANSRASTVARISGMTRGYCPSKCLGVSLFLGRASIIHFEYLIERIRKEIDAWKAKLLSFGGKITLIKAVLSSSPIYSMASPLVSTFVLNRIERLMANFLWNSKYVAWTHWVNWKRVCAAEEVGGLGIRGLHQIQQSLHAKLMWLVMRDDSLWAKFARAKYFDGDLYTTPSTASPLWRSIADQWPRLLHLTRWIVGDGKISFWGDNWCGEVLYGPLPRDRKLTGSSEQDHNDRSHPTRTHGSKHSCKCA